MKKSEGKKIMLTEHEQDLKNAAVEAEQEAESLLDFIFGGLEEWDEYSESRKCSEINEEAIEKAKLMNEQLEILSIGEGISVEPFPVNNPDQQSMKASVTVEVAHLCFISKTRLKAFRKLSEIADMVMVINCDSDVTKIVFLVNDLWKSATTMKGEKQ